MHRNLSHRVEIIFPVESPQLRKGLKQVLEGYLTDEAKARCLQPDGSYTRSPQRNAPLAVDIQASLLTPGFEVDHHPSTLNPSQ
jgi:polyphosphate kinase